MSQVKADSGTVILDQNGAEIGVIKKVYSENLARLELVNSDSIALDLVLIKDIETSGRILKKKSAELLPEAEKFIKGATVNLNEMTYNGIELIIDHLMTKEIKKALQHFEFDILNRVITPEAVSYYEILGLIRGIELAGKTPQDFIVKTTFQASELKPELKKRVPPEIVVDKLNQEKAFLRILWNFARIGVAQVVKLKEINLVNAAIDALFEIGLKHLEIESKTATTTDILHWQNRIEDCIVKYIVMLINSLEIETQEEFLNNLKEKLLEDLKKMKVNGMIKEHAISSIEAIELTKYENLKQIEFIYSGIKGFNLKVMSEKQAMKDLKDIVNLFLEEDETKSIMNLQKEITKFAKEVRDVSKEFCNILFEISQYLKKIEYGDSKVNDFYSVLMDKIHNGKYFDLSHILNKVSRIYLKEKL
ncbi:MAG: hypothetical protein KAJ76_03945 [Candidatus Heimdallarchaeota archaeon]|nr:hypothetical protein [Candidatus Heimdallarchaeota archaeon]MCK5158484.1 hypothetical protein [Candidatus Heimdallarchaeota archaeon]MCK5298034.1 hypothetical protein [Candidatus Heimdallarchaeota archaeon]